MRVSIVIPTFNRSALLKDTVRSALSQIYSDLEIIISDNASTDSTSKVVQEFLTDSRVKYFRNEINIGMVPNWHKAVCERATGDWFLLLSDDDVLVNANFISRAVEIAQSDKDVKLVYSNAYVYDESFNKTTELKIPFQTIEDGLKIFTSRGTVKPQDFALCGVLFPRELSKELKAFTNSDNLSCDTELFLKLCLMGKVGILHEFCSIYRIHSGNLLKSASKNLNFVIGSLDSLINPLLEANNLGLPMDKLREFAHNSKLKKEILICLLKIAAVDKIRVEKLKKQLQIKLGILSFMTLPSNWFLKFIIQLGPIIVPLFAVRKKLYFYLKKIQFHFRTNKSPY